MNALVVCLCGSTRFRAEIAEANRAATMAGKIVLAPGVVGVFVVFYWIAVLVDLWRVKNVDLLKDLQEVTIVRRVK